MFKEPLTKQQQLRKFASGGYSAALAFVHPAQLQEVRMNLSIWLNNIKEEHVDSLRVLNMIRLMKKQSQIKNIIRQQSKGIIDQDYNQKVFYKENDFYMNSSRSFSGLREEDIQDLLNGCLKQFYQERKEVFEKVLFNHVYKKLSNKKNGQEVGLELHIVRYLILSWKKHGLYDLIKDTVKEVLYID